MILDNQLKSGWKTSKKTTSDAIWFFKKKLKVKPIKLMDFFIKPMVFYSMICDKS
jgi:hypothetical protein